jgi:D-galactarolactone cycloisomerase
MPAALSTAPYIEYPYDPPAWTSERRDFILPQPARPDEPGLGASIDRKALEPLRIDLGTMA